MVQSMFLRRGFILLLRRSNNNKNDINNGITITFNVTTVRNNNHNLLFLRQSFLWLLSMIKLYGCIGASGFTTILCKYVVVVVVVEIGCNIVSVCSDECCLGQELYELFSNLMCVYVCVCLWVSEMLAKYNSWFRCCCWLVGDFWRLCCTATSAVSPFAPSISLGMKFLDYLFIPVRYLIPVHNWTIKRTKTTTKDEVMFFKLISWMVVHIYCVLFVERMADTNCDISEERTRHMGFLRMRIKVLTSTWSKLFFSPPNFELSKVNVVL